MLTQPWCWPPQDPADRPYTSDRSGPVFPQSPGSSRGWEPPTQARCPGGYTQPSVRRPPPRALWFREPRVARLTRHPHPGLEPRASKSRCRGAQPR